MSIRRGIISRTAVIIGLVFVPAMARGVEVYRKGDVSLDLGYWAQAWYQYVSDFDTDGDGASDEHLHDFMIRRTYFSIAGTVTPEISFFVHYSGDRIGQHGLDNPSLGLGSGLALRDGWVSYQVAGNDAIVQVGRMYVPFTRNYGTLSTKTLLTTDLDWGQGGIRSGIFYPNKVGRDDGLALWGNVLGDKLQYRLMVAEGTESGAVNPNDNLRFAGRLSFNLLEPETAWFNKGTYLGEKRLFAVGGGFDYQPDLILPGGEADYQGYTVDVQTELPVPGGILTAGTAYIWIHNTVNGIAATDIGAGQDGDIFTANLGFLIAGRIQPFAHMERFMPDADGADDATVWGLGANYYIKGQANKLTAEWTRVDGADEDLDIVTVQTAFGF
jgi:hypothetical protein